jgi:signal transduction histidine kinase
LQACGPRWAVDPIAIRTDEHRAMLRQKLLARLGLLVVGFVSGAVVSIVLLQGVLRDLDAVKADAAAMIDGVQDLNAQLSAFERDTSAAREGTGSEQEAIATEQASLQRRFEKLGEHEVMRGPEGAGAPVYNHIAQLLPIFLADATRLSAAPGPGPEIIAGSAELHRSLTELANIARRHVAAEQASLSGHLRTLIISLAIAAIIMTNVAIFVLVRTANMILRPVGELIAGTRELAQEHFDFRIGVSQHDEFDELAKAYNSLGDQLAANEQRKVRALQQLAVTLNHELNNAINIIELRLRLLDRRAGDDPQLASNLGDIHHNLARMAQTVASLRDVRRIVLTDYLPGQLMLDLARSTAVEDLTPVVKASSESVPARSSGARTP